ncbi:CRP-like cAMP-binding protein [Palleronia aestuarii]|uniref:CRP-like cAMP-binding protein n=1 Tax=Palleronia aestuarii TaxID=568105 RepID=A0A2W7NDJ9_9RHOB|nr:Crp/Fnr family transcriptional regulator [Palleronia aestuarii]PZX16217.1 CRP-like cAMP-binding protein [Palleronia aestuarii]
MTISRLLPAALAARDTLTEHDHTALASLNVRSQTFNHLEVILPAGPSPHESCLIVGGMALRIQTLGPRQGVTSAIHIPGDFVDLHGFLLDSLEHSVIAQGRCQVQFVDRAELLEITETRPHLTRLLWLITLIDAKINRTWVAAGAALRAAERIGHLMCELHARYAVIGAVENDAFEVPLEQQDLVRILGFSKTHINRAVQELRGRGLLEWSRGLVTLPDPGGLAEFSGFDPTFLEIRRIPR